MKYLSLGTINAAMYRINSGENTNEHRTGTLANSLIQNYFPVDKYTSTPEQMKVFSRKRPDFSIELLKDGNLIPHAFVEIKSLVNSDFNSIMDQLYDSILHTVDYTGGYFSVYVMAMKGTKIAFFQFYSFASLLDEHGIMHYKGFIPLNYLIPAYEYMDINKGSSLIDYLKYISKYNIPTNKNALINLGVESTSKYHFLIFEIF